MIENKVFRKGLVVGIILLFFAVSIIPTAIGTKTTGESNVIVKDISFGFKQVRTTIENTGGEDAEVKVLICYNSWGDLTHKVLNNIDVIIPIGETVKLSGEFKGLGIYRFIVTIYDGDIIDEMRIKGFWFFFFGLEM